MTAPAVSVVVPVCNGAKWLARCLGSVMAQSLDDFELLIGDDASEDDSLAVADQFRDPRVRVFRRDRRLGLFPNLNLLLTHARGPLVHFLCQDDRLYPDCLRYEAECFSRNPSAVMSVCQARDVDERGKEIGTWPVSSAEPILMPTDFALQMFLYHGCIAGNLSTVCIRRSVLQDSGYFDESYQFAGDYEMWTRICKFGIVLDLQKVLVELTVHSERLSLSGPAGLGMIIENWKTISGVLEMMGDEARAKALHYLAWRNRVLDAHYFVRCLLAARLGACKALVSMRGFGDLLGDLGRWLITGNNHLYRPKPPFAPNSFPLRDRGLEAGGASQR
jgi:glycosyltransferase involved in cell wall biosynthesis